MERGTEGMAARWNTTSAASNGGGYRGCSPECRTVEFDARANFVEIAFAPGQEIVNHTHCAIALGKKSAHQSGPNEPRAAGHDVMLHTCCRYPR